MSAESIPAAGVDFFAVAVRLKLISEAKADELRQESRDRKLAPESVALSRGALDAVQLDIVSSLLRPRETVPGYELIELVGFGGMGVVYRARQLTLNRIVALKTILMSRVGDVSATERFEQEAQTVGQLRHPNVVAAFDFGRAGGRLFLAMEFIDGTDADQLIEEHGQLEPALAWSLARQTAAGLAHALNHGVVHRDIKPANLLLVDPPEGSSLRDGVPMVKIADFGLARIAEADSRTRLTKENTTVGSPHYMAPEQLMAGDVDHRADMYALGMTVYHMLRGRPPFDGLALSQIYHRKMAIGPEKLQEHLQDLDPRSVALLERMTSIDPTGRPPNYTILMAEIDRLLATLPAPVTFLTTMNLEKPSLTAAAVATQAMAPLTTPGGQPAAVSQRPRGWKLGVWGLIAAAIAVIGMLMVKSRGPKFSTQELANLTSIGAPSYLFNAKSLAGWKTISGEWLPTDELEISGADGVIAHAFARTPSGGRREEIVPLFQLSLLVQRGTADAAELHFGLEAGKENGERYVAQVGREALLFGTRASDRQKFVETHRISLKSPEDQALHALSLECHPRSWAVRYEDEVVFTVARRSERELPEFRLAVVGRESLFSEVQFQELAESVNSSQASSQ
jgi:serine/threonine protein kinase